MKIITIDDRHVIDFIADATRMSDPDDFNGQVLIGTKEGSADYRIYKPNFSQLQVFDVASIPSNVVPHKFCYTSERGFYINSEYIEPSTSEVSIPTKDLDAAYKAGINEV